MQIKGGRGKRPPKGENKLGTFPFFFHHLDVNVLSFLKATIKTVGGDDSSAIEKIISNVERKQK